METIEQTLHKIKTITMTEKEKSVLRANLLELTKQPITTPVKSPYHAIMHPFIVSFASLIFVLLGGASISYGAGNALPGDKLYSFKINVNEKVAGIFIKSDTEKLIYQSKLLKNRIAEMNTMQESGKLTVENTAILDKAIDAHLENINKTAPALAKSNPEVVKQVAAALTDTVTTKTKIDMAATKEVPTLMNAKIAPLENPTTIKKSLLNENGIELTKETADDTSSKEKVEPANTVTTALQSVSIIDKLQEEKMHLDSLTNTTEVKGEMTITQPKAPITQ